MNHGESGSSLVGDNPSKPNSNSFSSYEEISNYLRHSDTPSVPETNSHSISSSRFKADSNQNTNSNDFPALNTGGQISNSVLPSPPQSEESHEKPLPDPNKIVIQIICNNLTHTFKESYFSLDPFNCILSRGVLREPTILVPNKPIEYELVTYKPDELPQRPSALPNLHSALKTADSTAPPHFIDIAATTSFPSAFTTHLEHSILESTLEFQESLLYVCTLKNCTKIPITSDAVIGFDVELAPPTLSQCPNDSSFLFLREAKYCINLLESSESPTFVPLHKKEASETSTSPRHSVNLFFLSHLYDDLFRRRAFTAQMDIKGKKQYYIYYNEIKSPYILRDLLLVYDIGVPFRQLLPSSDGIVKMNHTKYNIEKLQGVVIRTPMSYYQLKEETVNDGLRISLTPLQRQAGFSIRDYEWTITEERWKEFVAMGMFKEEHLLTKREPLKKVKMTVNETIVPVEKLLKEEKIVEAEKVVKEKKSEPEKKDPNNKGMIVVVAVVIIVVLLALMYRWWRRKAKKSPTEPLLKDEKEAVVEEL